MGGRHTFLVAVLALSAAALLAPAVAQGAFHLMLIREVYPGSAASPDSGYVELQMYTGGQQFVANHKVTVYGAGGAVAGTFTFPSNLSNGASQQTILVGDSGVAGAFGVVPDLVDSGFAAAAAGGAACWDGTPDCVAWGSFAGFSGPAPSQVGTPADESGIPNGMALRRSIAPGCPTLLEATDDSNNSAADFVDASPQPRNNASAIVESACTGPTTTIDSKPANPTSATAASFAYHSTPAGASFECRLDSAVFASCASGGVEYPGPLADGNHSFQVRAKDGSENVGPAATYGWKVDTIAPTAVLDAHPADPSPGATASFTYHANEVGATFECSLAAGAAADSFSACASSGKTYKALADGDYTFKVRAKDGAANVGGPASFEWTVDNALADTTPPDTVIDSAPPDPSTSGNGSFAYHSTEAGSTFECRLDGAAFAACPAAGIAYSGLGNGSHAFQVRAIDPSENVDPTPAGYSFDVAISSAPSASGSEPFVPPSLVPRASLPNTRFLGRPRRRTRDRTPTLRFRASVRGARFQCSLDRARFRGCRSPHTTQPLRPGLHRIRVRAIVGGAVDPTPAKLVFEVVGKRQAKRTERRR
jgi:hypothetical protein